MKGLVGQVIASGWLLWLLILVAGCDERGSEKVTIGPDVRIEERYPELTRVRPVIASQNLVRLLPVNRLSISSDILDLAYSDSRLLVASLGFIEEYDLNSLDRIRRLDFDPVTNHYGDLRDPRVYTVDYSPDGREIAFVLETAEGSTEVRVVSEGQETRLISGESLLALRKIRYIDLTRLLLATLESEVLLYDRTTGDQLYKRQLSRSSFSDFSFDRSSGRAVVADESGTVPVFEPISGLTLYTIPNGNFDRVYDIEFRAGTVLTGSKDRSATVYGLDRGTARKFDAGHHIYAVALSEKADRAVFPLFKTEEAIVMNLATEEITHSLDGAGKSLNMLAFLGSELVLGATYNEILIWSLE